MTWIGFGIALVAVAITFWTWGRFRGAMQQLEYKHERTIKAIESEHTKSIDRVSREAERTQHSGATALLKDIIPAMDALAEATKLTPDDEGMRAIESVLLQGLSRHQIEPIVPAPGDTFMPSVHEAIESVHCDIPRGKIANLFRAGWLQGEVCVRPAMVSVSSGQKAEDKKEEE